MKIEIVRELYRAFVLLGAESDLLGTVGSIGSELPDDDVIANLRAWNAASAAEIKRRIEHFEMTFPRQACTRAACYESIAEGP